MKNLLSKLSILATGIIIGVLCTIIINNSNSNNKTLTANTTTNIEQEQSQQVEIVRHITKETLKPEDNLTLNKEDHYFELSDGSWYLYNEAKNLYIFQPVNLGDWDYHVSCLDDLNNLVDTYLSMCNYGYY